MLQLHSEIKTIAGRYGWTVSAFERVSKDDEALRYRAKIWPGLGDLLFGIFTRVILIAFSVLIATVLIVGMVQGTLKDGGFAVLIGIEALTIYAWTRPISHYITAKEVTDGRWHVASTAHSVSWVGPMSKSLETVMQIQFESSECN